jgi:hypothetical protein
MRFRLVNPKMWHSRAVLSASIVNGLVSPVQLTCLKFTTDGDALDFI